MPAVVVKRPSKTIPTNRIEKAKQFELLRAFAIASGPDKKPLSMADVGKVAKLAQFTVSLMTAFFSECNFIRRTESGYVVADEVHEFCRAHKWDKDTAGHKLSTLVRQTWFAECLLPRLSFKEMSKTDAIAALADDASAELDYRPQIALLLDYLEFSGLITIDGESVSLHSNAESMPSSPLSPVSPTKPEVSYDAKPTKAPEAMAPRMHAAPAVNGLAFSINVNVSIDEMSGWTPDRIAAFWSGVAQVLSAKRGLESEG